MTRPLPPVFISTKSSVSLLLNQMAPAFLSNPVHSSTLRLFAYAPPSKANADGLKSVSSRVSSSQKTILVVRKLVDGSGVDACHYGPNCTHVIVDKIAYDDLICVAARRDGKILVSGLWVDHSFDVGVRVDTTSLTLVDNVDQCNKRAKLRSFFQEERRLETLMKKLDCVGKILKESLDFKGM